MEPGTTEAIQEDRMEQQPEDYPDTQIHHIDLRNFCSVQKQKFQSLSHL